MKTELYQNNTNKWSQSFSTLILIFFFFFFFPFISFLGLFYLFIFYLYIFHQNWGGENPTNARKLWRGTVPLVFLLSCWNWVYKECENSLWEAWEAALCDCLPSGQCLIWDFLTVLENMLQVHNLIHFASPGFAKVPAEVELLLLRELMFNSENCQIFFFLSFLHLMWCMCRHEYDLMAAVVGGLYLSSSVVQILWCSVVNCPVHLLASEWAWSVLPPGCKEHFQ